MSTTMLSSELIRKQALSVGFSACGVAPAEPVSNAFAEAYRRQLSQGHHGTMDYLARNLDKRFDPRLLHEGTQCVVSVAMNYFPQRQLAPSQYQFAWYAYGKDYHDVVRQRLSQLLERLQAFYPDLSGRAFCDTAPVPERYWAWRCGLGFIGRNSQLIVPHAGSCFFLGELFLTLPADAYDTPIASRCGTCSACIDACPTGALTPDGVDARRCLSYLTIENRGPIPPEAADRMGQCIYGCDCCLKACPHNRFARPTDVPEFAPSDEFLAMTPEAWHTLTPELYRTLFRGSAVKRAKFDGLLRNINALRNKNKS